MFCPLHNPKLVTCTCQFKTEIDYSRSLADSIKAAKYDWQDENITEDLFPLQLHESGERELVYEYVEFDYDATFEEAWNEMERNGQRPPTARETLWFAEKCPDEQRKRPIIGAALVPDAGGSYSVLYLYAGAGVCSLGLCWGHPRHFRWLRQNRFLAVRK